MAKYLSAKDLADFSRPLSVFGFGPTSIVLCALVILCNYGGRAHCVSVNGPGAYPQAILIVYLLFNLQLWGCHPRGSLMAPHLHFSRGIKL